MHGKFVKVKYEDFMQFVPAVEPSTEEWTNAFNGIASKMPEAALQDAVVDIINAKKMCGEDHIAISTQNRADPNDVAKQRPDCGVYRTEQAPSDHRTNWFTQRLTLEFKRETVSDDPFSDSKADFEEVSEARRTNRGQIIQYASEIFLRQQRCFHFSVVILGTCARLIRWDRSGAIVSEKFDYKVEPRKLAEFLWRFSHSSLEQQGDDTTATLVVPGSDDYKAMDNAAAERAEDNAYVRQFFAHSLQVDDVECQWPRWKMAVYDETERSGDDGNTSSEQASSGKAVRYFLVGKPHFHTRGVSGRGTRGYVALDCDTKEFVYLKDAWRVDLDGIRKEGVVLQELNRNRVRNVPTLCCHGDVPGQCSVTWRHWGEGQGPNPMKKHTHYRLVEREVGRPLKDFSNSALFLKVMLDCLRAHRDAYVIARILHRDISSGNILIVSRFLNGKWVPCGLLNDWELSKSLPDGPGYEPKARQPDRTGTWQFMSALALNDPYKPIILQDDLEAFFHVILYYAIRFFQSNCDDVGRFIDAYFHAAEYKDGRDVCGGAKWKAMETGAIKVLVGKKMAGLQFPMTPTKPELSTLHDTRTSSAPTIAQQAGSSSTGLQQIPSSPESGVETVENHPVGAVIDELLLWFGAYYQHLEAQERVPKRNPSVRDPSVRDPTEDEFFDKPDAPNGEVEVGPDQASIDSAREVLISDPKAKAKKEIAASLSSHIAICALLNKYGWLCSGLKDKTEDRLSPAKVKPSKCGDKRSSEAVETKTESNKRVKSSHQEPPSPTPSGPRNQRAVASRSVHSLRNQRR